MYDKNGNFVPPDMARLEAYRDSLLKAGVSKSPTALNANNTFHPVYVQNRNGAMDAIQLKEDDFNSLKSSGSITADSEGKLVIQDENLENATKVLKKNEELRDAEAKSNVEKAQFAAYKDNINSLVGGGDSQPADRQVLGQLLGNNSADSSEAQIVDPSSEIAPQIGNAPTSEADSGTKDTSKSPKLEMMPDMYQLLKNTMSPEDLEHFMKTYGLKVPENKAETGGEGADAKKNQTGTVQEIPSTQQMPVPFDTKDGTHFTLKPGLDRSLDASWKNDFTPAKTKSLNDAISSPAPESNKPKEDLTNVLPSVLPDRNSYSSKRTDAELLAPPGVLPAQLLPAPNVDHLPAAGVGNGFGNNEHAQGAQEFDKNSMDSSELLRQALISAAKRESESKK